MLHAADYIRRLFFPGGNLRGGGQCLHRVLSPSCTQLQRVVIRSRLFSQRRVPRVPRTSVPQHHRGLRSGDLDDSYRFFIKPENTHCPAPSHRLVRFSAYSIRRVTCSAIAIISRDIRSARSIHIGLTIVTAMSILIVTEPNAWEGNRVHGRPPL